MKEVLIDLEELYINGDAGKPAWKLLMFLLENYNLSDRVVYLANESPDVGVEVIINNVDKNSNINLKIILNEGYERAEAWLI